MEWKIVQDALVSALAAAAPLQASSPVEVPPPEEYDSDATMPIAHSPLHSTTDDDACMTPESEATTVVSSDCESPGLVPAQCTHSQIHRDI